MEGSEQNPQGPPGGGQPTEEEMRAAIEEQMREVRVEDLLVQTAASLVNLTARRIAKPDEQDLDQGRIGIDALRALSGVLPEDFAAQVRNALTELQMLYAREAGAGPGGPAEGQEGGRPPAPEQPPPGDPGGRPGPGGPGGGPEPPPRLWTPRGSS